LRAVTLEDELQASGFYAVGRALERGLSVHESLLIHPNTAGEKLTFEKDFVNGVRPFAWFGSIRTYGAFWSARDQVQVLVTRTAPSSARIEVLAPQRLDGLTLQLPAGWRVQADAAVRLQQGRDVVLGKVQGVLVLRMHQPS
jgi:hypothetical protein